MAEERPRFRSDLVATPLEADGVSYVETTDPRAGTSFRFYAVEHAIAEAFDGRPLPEVATWARESGLDLTVEQLSAFASHLTELGFLEPAADDSNGQAAHRDPDEDGRTREMPPLDSALAATRPDSKPTPAGGVPVIVAAEAARARAAREGHEEVETDEYETERPEAFTEATRSGPSLEAQLAAAGAQPAPVHDETTDE